MGNPTDLAPPKCAPAMDTGLRWFARLAGLALLCGATSCLSFEFDRLDVQSPPPATAVADLAIGSTTLEECLHSLGAPWRVRELLEGSELIWGWQRNKGWNTSVSVPISDQGSGNFSYTRTIAGGEGLTLRFDADWVLVEVRSGRLKDLIESRSAPPLLVESTP